MTDEAGFLTGFDVLDLVVDEQRLTLLKAEALHRQVKDRHFRLH